MVCEKCGAKIEPCVACKTTGSVECKACDGTGQVTCTECDHESDCKECDGEGELECSVCDGTGYERCLCPTETEKAWGKTDPTKNPKLPGLDAEDYLTQG